ncbi:MAG: type II secretion system F family protein [Alphaproteobacteria bacterium]|nr:type II secretion system F family protein [Alphaproteobacteria bacterium]
MTALMTLLPITPQGLILFAIFAGVLMMTVGVWMLLGHSDRQTVRMQATAAAYLRHGSGQALLKTPDQIPEGMLKALIPQDGAERTLILAQLQKAGFDGPNAVRNFFVMRLVLALILPAAVGMLLALRSFQILPDAVAETFASLTPLRITQIIAGGVAVGFYGPTIWLKRRIDARRRAIEEAFPNALDLLQIAVGAGMGFDAAMVRVGQALATVSPVISAELLLCHAEVLAGRDRAGALQDMALRTGVDEVAAFAQLISQSMAYGTSISDAMTAYAVEMRETREMKAVEKANKLPVQMSAVMASMMLPALFILTIGPTVLRYMAMGR